MTSRFWDDKLAARYREFRYEFADCSLAGRTVAVAGGTGGLGAATVALLAREGARLVVGYRSNKARAESLRRAIEAQFAQRIVLVAGDIAEADVRRRYLDACRELGGAPYGAAIFPGDPARAKLEALDREALEASLRVNFTGPLLLARDLGQAMTATGGSLVLLATMQAVAAFPGSVNYAAPKAALAHAARILALEWPAVRVNVVAPGATVAGMAEASVQSGKYDRYVESGAVPRFGRPEDIARAVRFFLEPDNYVTGQCLVVDGGLTLHRG